MIQTSAEYQAAIVGSPRRIEILATVNISDPDMEYGEKPCRRVRLDALAAPEHRARQRFRARMASLLREEVVAALRDAKAGHDALEAVYNPYVDFDGVRTLAALETGRLLSWLS